MTIAKLPLAKEIGGFGFAATPINEGLVRDLATGGFLAGQRNAVLVGGTGTGKTHLAIAIGRACVRAGARVRFYNTIDLVNRLEAESRSGRPGRLVIGRARDPHQPTSRGDGHSRGPVITDVVALLGRAVLRTAPFRNSNSRVRRPTRRSRAAMRASYSCTRSAARASSRAPASYLSTQATLFYDCVNFASRVGRADVFNGRELPK